jgi:hypothetical protein
MSLFWKALWFIVALLGAGLAKLLFDNILYAAIMRYLGTYGIMEGDLIAVVTTNLIPVIGTIVVVALIYWLASQHHASKTMVGVAPVSAANNPSRGIFKRILISQGPLPSIALSLAIAFSTGIYWQINYGPLTQLRRPPPAATKLTEAEKKDRLNFVVTTSNSVDTARLAMAKAHELSENWQYRMQTGVADFNAELAAVSTGLYLAKYALKNGEAISDKWPDMAAITKDDLPDCDTKTNAFIAEIKRINDRKGADLVFTLLNDVKLIEWRASLLECDRWISGRIEAVAARRAALTAKGGP